MVLIELELPLVGAAVSWVGRNRIPIAVVARVRILWILIGSTPKILLDRLRCSPVPLDIVTLGLGIESWGTCSLMSA